eukprot:CAMPEP_0173382742 /NCGR_PEP_ID=MMETSP1356-20130122/5278_1 /TAXON_ID=77927 ORGANISM="Hemiselmis virescens, Strain PCC157" /NCGR_SAMPLE_ID=MMETSP1356 /ASSEMBLY_ACC=CAM_ASM_000847 /LENGTH=33 /DNA_ID= /DNA_START= /DNA_END= /DNA_ORIENTATION=
MEEIMAAVHMIYCSAQLGTVCAGMLCSMCQRVG